MTFVYPTYNGDKKVHAFAVALLIDGIDFDEYPYLANIQVNQYTHGFDSAGQRVGYEVTLTSYVSCADSTDSAFEYYSSNSFGTYQDYICPEINYNSSMFDHPRK